MVGKPKKIFKQVKSGQDREWLQVVPKAQRSEIIKHHHDPVVAGHMGVSKTLARINQKFYWPKMRSDVARYVRNCVVCQKTKPEQKKVAGLMAGPNLVDQPWQMISADIVGPLPRSTSGYLNILVVSDYFSKFALFFPIRSPTAAVICKLIEEQIFLLFGVPKILITDNGVQFTSSKFKDMCAEYKVQHKTTALYHPQANPTERINRVLKTMLSSYIENNHRDWEKYLAKIGTAIRTAKHNVTGHSPYKLNFGREQILSGDEHNVNINLGQDVEFDRQSQLPKLEFLSKLFKDVRSSLIKAYERNKHYYDLKRRDVEYRLGEQVLRRNFAQSDAGKYFSSKLAPKFVGPFRIAKKLSPWMYKLEDEYGNDKGSWNTKDLKPFYSES